MSNGPVIEARRVSKSFSSSSRPVLVPLGPGARVKAVDDLSLGVMKGETLGLVGESGCGKSTLGRIMLDIVTPDAGEVLFHGEPVQTLSGLKRGKMKRSVSAVFQDPNSSLDPRMKIGESLAEPLKIHGLWQADGDGRIRAMLAKVGLPPDSGDRYPHEFSGGQRQRVAIARALMLGPELVICDEPVSALDPSVQAQVLNLLLEQKHEMGPAYLFISHDLAVVRHMSDRIAVMYSGRLVESGPSVSFGDGGLHPYTRFLFASIPGTGRGRYSETDPTTIEEFDVGGCAFRPRCSEALPICTSSAPPGIKVATGHIVYCHRFAP